MADPYKHGRREVAYRFDVLRRGAKYAELPAVGAPTLTMTYNAEVKSTLSGTFRRVAGIDYLNDLVRPMMRIDGAWYPLGEFTVARGPEQYDGAGDTMQLEAYDRGLYLKQAATNRRVMFAAGNRYLDVIQAILIENGIDKITADANSDVLQTDREDWEIGTSYLTIINQLLGEINYNSLWFDKSGNARLTKYVPPARAPVTHAYEAGAVSVLKPGHTVTTDLYEAYNVFVKVVSSPDFPFPLVARAVNDDPNSPSSTVRRGREITDPDTRLDNIASQQALQEYVNNLMERSKLSARTVAYETANMPTHGLRDIVSIRHRGFTGLVAETKWSMQLGYDGCMGHEGRVVAL